MTWWWLAAAAYAAIGVEFSSGALSEARSQRRMRWPRRVWILYGAIGVVLVVCWLPIVLAWWLGIRMPWGGRR